MSWLDDYRAGRHSQVWREMRQLGDRIREAQYLPAAVEVCDEMARRAKHNIETLISRLLDQGYRFHDNDDDETPCAPFYPASAAADGLVDWLEQNIGSVPLTVASWIRLVGDVWLVGTHPDWPESSGADPLVIEIGGLRYPSSPIWEYYHDEYESWQGSPTPLRVVEENLALLAVAYPVLDHEGRVVNETDRDFDVTEYVGGRSDVFVLPVAPDRLHKGNASGGSPYGFELPDGCADGLFHGDSTEPFVNYLNRVFVNGGFVAPTTGHYPLRQELAKGLLPL